MDKIKKSCLFRIISLVLIITFISLDISYAYPPEHNAANSTLATPSALQQTPVTEQAARFQQSVFSQGALLASVYDIGEYFFGNTEKVIGSLPSKYAQDVMRADLEKHLSDAGTEILNIVPVEYIKKTAPEKLRSALDEIGFKGTLPDEGVVFILYKKGGKKFLVQIARKDQVSSDSLPGYEWEVSDKYVVKYMLEDYEAPQGEILSLPKNKGPSEQVAQAPTIPVTPTVETKEAPKVTITEPIVEIKLPKTKTEELSTAPARKLTIRAIIASAMFVMLFTPYAFAGTSGADGAVTLSFNPFLSGIFIASAAIIASIFLIRYLNAFTTAPHPTKPYPKMVLVAALGWIAMMSFMPLEKGTVLLALMTSFPIGFELFAYLVSVFGGIERKKYERYDTVDEAVGAVLKDCANLTAEGKILKANLLFKAFFETPIETKVKRMIFGGPFDVMRPLFSEGVRRFNAPEVTSLGYGQQYQSVYHMLERANRNRSFFKKIGRASFLIVVAATAFLIPTAAQSQGISAFPAPLYSGIGFGPQYMGFGEELLGSAISTAIVMGVSLMVWLIAKRVFKRDFRIALLAIPLTVLIMTPFHPFIFAMIVPGFICGSVPFFKKLIPPFMLRGGRMYKIHPIAVTLLYAFLTSLCTMDFSYGGGSVLPLIGLFVVSLNIAAGLTKNISKYRSLKMSDTEKEQERSRLRKLFEEGTALARSGKVMEAMMTIKDIRSPLLELNSPHFEQKMHEEFMQMLLVVKDGVVGKIREEESSFVMSVGGASIRVVPVHKKQRMADFANALPFEERFILIVDLEDLAAEGMGKTGIRGMEPVLAKIISAMRKDARLGMFRDIGSELVLIRMEALAPVIADRKHGGMGVSPDKAFKYDTLEAKIKEAGFRTLRTNFFSAPGSFINFSFVPPGIIAFGAAASTNAASKSLSEFIGLGSGEGWYMTLLSVGAIMAAGQAVMWAIGKLLRLRKGVSTLLTIAIAVAVLVSFDAKLAGLSLLGFFLMYFEGSSTKVGLPWSQGFAPVRLSYTDYRQWADEAVASVKDGNAARYLSRSDIPGFLKRYFKAALFEARIYKIAPFWAFLVAVPYIASTILFYPPQAQIGYIWFVFAASILGWGTGMLVKYIKGHPRNGSASENAQNKAFSIKGILRSVFGKTYSINPFAVGLGVVGLASIFFAVKDFAFAHPIITAISALGILFVIFSFRVMRAGPHMYLQAIAGIERNKFKLREPYLGYYENKIGQYTYKLMKAGHKAVPAFAAALRSGDVYRIRPTIAILNLIDEGAYGIEYFTSALSNPSPLIRYSATRGIGGLIAFYLQDSAAIDRRDGFMSILVRRLPALVNAHKNDQSLAVREEAGKTLEYIRSVGGIDFKNNDPKSGSPTMYSINPFVFMIGPEEKIAISANSSVNTIHLNETDLPIVRMKIRDAIMNLQNTLRSSSAIYADIAHRAQKNEAGVSVIGEVFPDFDKLESIKKWGSNFLQHTLEFIKTLEMVENNNAVGINKVKKDANRELLKPGVVDEYNKLFQKLFSQPRDRECIFLTALLHDIGARDGTVGHEDKGAVWIGGNLPVYYKGDVLFVEKVKWLIGQHVAMGTMFFGERTPDRLLRLLDELPDQLKDYKEELLGALAIITFCDGGAMIDNDRAEYYINTNLSALEERKHGFLVYRLRKLANLESVDEELISKKLGKLYDTLGEKGKAIFIKQVGENLDALDYGLAFTGSIIKGIDNPEERLELILKMFCMLAFIAKAEDECGEDIKWWVEFVGLNAEGDKVAAKLTPEHVRVLKGLELKELTFEKVQSEYQSGKPLFGIFKVERGVKIFESKPEGKGKDQSMLSISVSPPARNDLTDLKQIQGKPTDADIKRIIKEKNLNDADQVAFVLAAKPEQGMGDNAKVKDRDNPRVSQLFELVESLLNSERAKFIETGNRLISSVPSKPDLEVTSTIGVIDKTMATAEIRQKAEKAIAAIGSLDKEGVTPETKTAIELLKKNLNQFEADGAVGSLIVLARKAKKENQKLIIGLETDWIPGITVENSLQRQAITALMKEIDSIAEALESMGLDNVEVIRGSGNQLASTILNEAEKTHTKMHNIVVMASANTINSDSFAALRNADENDRPFLAGIDPTELIKLYTEFGESVSKQLYIRLASLLYMTLELAAGKEPPQSPIIVSYDKKLRILILLPKADPIDYEMLKNNYAAEKTALAAA